MSIGGQVPSAHVEARKRPTCPWLAADLIDSQVRGICTLSEGQPSHRHRRISYRFGHVKRCLFVRARITMSARDWPPEGVCAETGLQWGARPQRLKQCVADRSVARIGASRRFSPKAHGGHAIGRSCSGAAWLRWRILLTNNLIHRTPRGARARQGLTPRIDSWVTPRGGESARERNWCTVSDGTLAAGTRQRWPKCGTGQSDQATSVSAHEPGAATAHVAPWHPAPRGGCETCSAAVEAAKYRRPSPWKYRRDTRSQICTSEVIR